MKKEVVWGIAAGFSLLAIYFLVMILASSWNDALFQLRERWYWILLLVLGFGVQSGLYRHMKGFLSTTTTSSIVASGGTSSVGMIACCAHHVTDIAPLLGISALALFLNQFQTFFIVLGVLSNFIGIQVMLLTMQKHHLHHEKGILGKAMQLPLRPILYVTLFMSVGVLFFLVRRGG